ncbi:hypothetical protein [Vibrio barjaei]|uniref:DHHA1 domain-containing protein n=1 Tax=Vibrio barjaei TaxID=1676683 RepID=UPI0022848C52|nr:hypothetical protein [Vibrio barjaei]MCY9874517.1 hypothetical protein [Vibrio barjaei]
MSAIKTDLFDRLGLTLSKELKVHVLYHGQCSDGTASAVVCKMALEDRCTLTFQESHYGMTLEDYELDPSVDLVMLVDFSFKRDDLFKLCDNHLAIIIDHHEGAEEELHGFEHQNCVVEFEKDQSGALMCWNLLFGSKPPAFIEHISDRDLFNFNDPNTKAFVLGVVMNGFGIEAFEEAFHADYDTILERGRKIDDVRTSLMEEAYSERFYVDMMYDDVKYKVPVASTNRLMHSELAEMLYERENSPFSIVISMSKRGFGLSFRSPKNGGFSIRELAMSFGGNGHATAAGGRVDKIQDLGAVHSSSVLSSDLDFSNESAFTPKMVELSQTSSFQMKMHSEGNPYITLAPSHGSLAKKTIKALIDDPKSEFETPEYVGVYRVCAGNIVVCLKAKGEESITSEVIRLAGLYSIPLESMTFDEGYITFATTGLATLGNPVSQKS